VVVLAVDSIGTASSGKEQTIVSSSFFIEEISSSITNIKFGVASGESCLFVLLIFGTDVFAEPKVVFLITLFVGIVIGK